MSSLAIIVPCFNEEKRLDQLAFSQFAQLHQHIQIVFVNDGSSDKTVNIIENIIACHNNTELVNLSRNMGKGEAVRQGLIHAAKSQSFNFIGYLDADLSASLEEFQDIYKYSIEKNADFIFGSRIKKLGSVIRRSYLRHIVGRILVTVIDKKFQLGYYDTQCGAKIFKSSLLQNILHKPFFTKWFFDIEIFLRLKAENKNYVGIEYPLQTWENKKGSKINLLSFPIISKEIFVLLSKY
jgi:glycosyltransferase involved in cell wall biosynthesis